ncbi:hypothetical protein HY772_10215 [Candidatus Woesearchaeota archaeon]|nr:hypothetical protein [Candidatus Woesearchaeota archaeon]
MSGYQVNGSSDYFYGGFEEMPVQDRNEDASALSIEEAFKVAAQETAASFFQHGGGSFDAADSYTVQPQGDWFSAN